MPNQHGKMMTIMAQICMKLSMCIHTNKIRTHGEFQCHTLFSFQDTPE